MTYKEMVISRLKSLNEPITCACLKNLIYKKYKAKLKDGTISSILYRLYKKGFIHRYENFGPLGGMGYLVIRLEGV